MKKFMLSVLLALPGLGSIPAQASNCNVQGKVTRVTPSAGVPGVFVEGTTTGCACDGSDSVKTLMWIDISTDGGKSLYSSALAAKLSNTTVVATIVDGRGQGAAGNTSVTLRYWASCQLVALELL